MLRKQQSQLVSRLKSNSEPLTHIHHSSDPFPYKTLRFSLAGVDEVCPISVARCVVQLSYVYYTCVVAKCDLSVAREPVYSRKVGAGGWEVRLLFRLGSQHEECEINKKDNCNQSSLTSYSNADNPFTTTTTNNNNLTTTTPITNNTISIINLFPNTNINKQHLKNITFVPFKSHKYNITLIQYITTLISKHKDMLSQRNQQLSMAKLMITSFVKHIKKNIEPLLNQNQELPVIKMLEKTRLFIKHSYLLMIYKSSIFYKIRHDLPIHEQLKTLKANYQTRIMYRIENLNKNQHQAYKELDLFLLGLISKQVLHMEKSSTKDPNDSDVYAVGAIVQQIEGERYMNNYEARFYTLYTNQPESTKPSTQVHGPIHQQDPRETQKNFYILSYSLQTLGMQLKYVSMFECSPEYMDAISSHCSNMSSYNTRLSIEPIEFIQSNMNMNSVVVKKYVAFKVQTRVDRTEEPFTKVFLLMEYVTICAKVFLELLTKKADKDQSVAIGDYGRRLAHLLSLFVDKASYFYQSL